MAIVDSRVLLVKKLNELIWNLFDAKKTITGEDLKIPNSDSYDFLKLERGYFKERAITFVSYKVARDTKAEFCTDGEMCTSHQATSCTRREISFKVRNSDCEDGVISPWAEQTLVSVADTIFAAVAYHIWKNNITFDGPLTIAVKPLKIIPADFCFQFKIVFMFLF
jgi:hypothetical protein